MAGSRHTGPHMAHSAMPASSLAWVLPSPSGLSQGLTLGLCQRLLDESQHKLPLGELMSSAGSLPFQVGFDALEQFLVDLEGEGPGFSVRHGIISPVSFDFKIFSKHFCDVLTCGLACPLLGFGNPVMQIQVNLSA